MTVPAKHQAPRSIRIEDVHTIDCQYLFGGFELKIEGQTANGARATARIELHFCDMEELARHMWRMVKQRQDRINAVSKALKGEIQ